MNKIHSHSVITTPEGSNYLVIEHRKKFIKTLNEGGMEMFISESEAERSTIRDGGEAMDVIKKFWYGP